MAERTLNDATRPETARGGGAGREHGTAAKFLAVTLGFVMAALDITVVNIAGARIRDELGLSVAQVTWQVDGYMVTFAALLLLSGSLTGRFGAKRTYLIGLAGFVTASLACAVAPTGEVLIAARLVQGAAAALFLPASLVLLTASFPDQAVRTRMIAFWSTAGAAASGIGPLLGGALVSWLGWRSIFFINLPLGIVTFILALKASPSPAATSGVRLNVPRHILLGLGLASLTFVLVEGGHLGWMSAGVIGAAAVTVTSWICFAVWESHAKERIFPPALVRNPHFLAANGTGLFLNFGLYAVQFMLGLFLQTERGASPLLAGVQVLPMMAMFTVGNLLYARLPRRFGTRWPAFFGLAVGAVSAAALVWLDRTTPYWWIAGVLVVGNLGIGVAVPAMTVRLMTAAGPEHAGMGSATFNATRQIGTLLGVALAGTLIASLPNWYAAARWTFLACALAYALGALAAITRDTATQRTPTD